MNAARFLTQRAARHFGAFAVSALCALSALAQEVANAPGAVLRVLDKTASQTEDVTLQVGQSTVVGSLQIVLTECRYPSDNPTGDAFALLEVVEQRQNTPLFSGWMIASSPALSALEHQRYDVWVIRCTTSGSDG